MNWVHVRNLVQAHVLAAEALTAARGYVAVSAPRAARRSPSLAHTWLTGVSPQLRMAGMQDCGPRDTWGGGLSRASRAPGSEPGTQVTLIPNVSIL